MTAPKSIVWLASYPKSGNTWTRIFLANYLMNADQPVPINQVHRFGVGDSVAKMYHMVAGRQIDVTDIGLTLKLRDKVLRAIVANKAQVNFVKTHNIRDKAFGVTLIPDQYTRSAVYLVRNPLDVLMSYARHYGMSNEEAAYTIGHTNNTNASEQTSVPQFLGSWSEHVESWTSPAPYPSIVLRYEDLLDQPQENFGKLLQHIGIPVEEDRLDKAIRFSSFKELSSQEEKSGFVESSPKNEKFFSKGKSGQWKQDLSPELIAEVKKKHRKVMKKFGYLE